MTVSSEDQRSPWSSALLFHWRVLKQAVARFGAQEVPTRAAALAFCTVFSLPSLLFIVIWTAGHLDRDVAARDAVFSEIGEMVGEEGAQQLMATIEGLEIQEPTWWAKLMAVGALLSTATLVLLTMQDSLNRVFEVERVQSAGLGIWRWLRSRFLSLAMLACIAYILTVSLAVSAAIEELGAVLQRWIGGLANVVTAFDFFLLELATTTLLFAVIYRYLPTVRPGWRDVWFGAFLAAAVLTAGEDLIGRWIGRSMASDLYGAAGSVLVLLLWVYYASAIVLFGGSVTAVRATLPTAEREAERKAE